MLPDNKPAPPPPAKAKTSRARLVIGVLALLAAAFAAGYVPKMFETKRLDESLRGTQRDLRLADLHRTLGVAALEAQRNNFANASTAASEFFQGCRVLAQSEPFPDRPRTKLALDAYSASEQEIAPMLANANPEAKERLSTMYLTMDGVIKRRQ